MLSIVNSQLHAESDNHRSLLMAQEESLATVASNLRTDAFENQTQNLFLWAVGLQYNIHCFTRSLT